MKDANPVRQNVYNQRQHCQIREHREVVMWDENLLPTDA
jgi:hypothetical protein